MLSVNKISKKREYAIIYKTRILKNSNFKGGSFMLKEIVVKQLFGKYDYDLHFENDNRFTILTSLNGYGKTTIFRLIDSLAKGSMLQFIKTPFKSIVFKSDSVELTFEKDENSLILNDVHLVYSESINELYDEKNYSLLRPRISAEYIKTRIVTRSDFDFSIYLNNSNIKTSDKLILFNYLIRQKNKKITDDVFEKTIDKILLFMEEFNSIVYLKDNRIFDIEKDKVVKNRIEEINTSLVSQIQNTINEYHDISSKLDAEFIIDLDKTNRQDMSKETFEELNNQLHSISNECMEYGFNEATFPNNKYNQKYKNIYFLYFENTIKKLNTFVPLVVKFSTFLSIVNNSLNGKKVSIQKTNGLLFVDKITNERIDIESLSSGEQNLIILYYDLIFSDEKNILFLIDEPEISLHLAWQKDFVNNVIKIQKEKEKSGSKIQVIIATHAPGIINGHWQSVLDLTTLSNG